MIWHEFLGFVLGGGLLKLSSLSVCFLLLGIDSLLRISPTVVCECETLVIELKSDCVLGRSRILAEIFGAGVGGGEMGMGVWSGIALPAPSLLNPHGGPKWERCKDGKKNKFRN